MRALAAKTDWVLLACVGLLTALGLVAIYSVALGSSSGADLLNFKKQAVFAGAGMLLLLGVAWLADYRALARLSVAAFALSCALLVAVLAFGSTIRGTTGWFSLGFFAFQPVEIVKICVIIFLAKFFSDKARLITDLRYVGASGAGVIVIMGLVLLQPDFGSALIIGAIWGGFTLLSGMRRGHILMLAAMAVIAGLVLWFFIFAEFQRDRVRVFLDPSLDPLGRGYNVTQALIAIGSGGFFGKGIGFGSQSQLKFLPESQTDFIFAVIGEEMGFAGVLLVTALYGVVFARLLAIARASRDNFGTYIVLGAGLVLFSHITINMGMNLGLLPVTGLTLPFVSYGGSSLLANMLLIGLAESVAIRNT